MTTLDEVLPQPDIMEELSPRRTGIIRGADDLHRASGGALIFDLEDERGIARLENFEAVRGPGLHVYLARHRAPQTQEDLGADFLDLGPLKANRGNHNYRFTGAWRDYRSLVIYSQPFGSSSRWRACNDTSRGHNEPRQDAHFGRVRRRGAGDPGGRWHCGCAKCRARRAP